MDFPITQENDKNKVHGSIVQRFTVAEEGLKNFRTVNLDLLNLEPRKGA